MQAVIGPEQVAKRTAPLKNTGNELRTSNEKGGDLYELNRLGPGLDRAANGVSQIRNGLARAAAGAGLLGEGSGNAEDGALQIADGLGQAIEGGGRAVRGITRIDEGSGKLAEGSGEIAEGQEEAKIGAEELHSSTKTLAREPAPPGPEAGQQAQTRTGSPGGDEPAAEGGVGTRRRNSPLSSTPCRSRATGAREKAGELHAGEIRLENGNERLHEGSTKLHKGTTELSDEASALPEGLEELQDGTFRLANGINRLQGGSETLQSNLAEGFHRSYPLQAGLRRTSVKVTKGAGSMSRRVDQINTESPGLFDSGYFVPLGDRRGATGRTRAGRRSDQPNHGGQGAAITVISKYTFNTTGSTELDQRLKDYAAEPRRRTRSVEAGVAGGPPSSPTTTRSPKNEFRWSWSRSRWSPCW